METARQWYRQRHRLASLAVEGSEKTSHRFAKESSMTLPLGSALIAATAAVFHALRETKQLLRLEQFPPLPDDRLPPLSLVVAARDEGETIGPALGSLLALEYPLLEVILVDDRSSDDTATIARAIGEAHPRGDRLRLIENRELPDGWLGKVHAQHLGVAAASHPLILLTDADVLFSPDALRRAVTAQQVLGADHIAVLPRLTTNGFWEPALAAYLETLVVMLFRPSSLHRSPYRFVGVGAFALLTRDMLTRIEAMKPLRLQVIDDGFLGLMVKARKGRQFVLVGQQDLALRWFSGLTGFLKGLEKNAYSAVGYRFPLALGMGLVASTPFWLLVLLAFVSPGSAVAAYGLMVSLTLIVGRAQKAPAWSALVVPLASVVVGWAFVRSAIITERRQAVVWRDTAYSLPELREAQRSFISREFARLRGG